MVDPRSLFDVSGRRALVTGGGQGIGKAFVMALAQAGAHVAAADLDLQTCGAVAEEAGKLGVSAVGIKVDVTSADEVGAMVETAVRELGGLDIAVNCAGIGGKAPSFEIPLERFRRVVDVNLTGVFICCRAEAAYMVKRGRGKIVNIASMSGTVINKGRHMASYCASKAGVAHLTRSLAIEWIGSGVYVNALSPGYVRTPFLAPVLKDAAMVRDMESETPIGRLGTTDDLVGAMLFLVSDASDYVVGHNLAVDGGYTVW